MYESNYMQILSKPRMKMINRFDARVIQIRIKIEMRYIGIENVNVSLFALQISLE
jgi:hypothetical protein